MLLNTVSSILYIPKSLIQLNLMKYFNQSFERDFKITEQYFYILKLYSFNSSSPDSRYQLLYSKNLLEFYTLFKFSFYSILHKIITITY